MGNACAVSVMTGMEGVGRKDLFELLGTDIVLALFMVASGVGNLSGGLAPEDVSGSLEGLSDHPSDRHKVERLTEVLKSLAKGEGTLVTVKTAAFIMNHVNVRVRQTLLVNLAEQERIALLHLLEKAL